VTTKVTCAKGLGHIGALALLLACPVGAYANTVSYAGQGTHLKAGQTKGLPMLMGFDLIGKNCPGGARCFKHAKVQNFDGVSYAFPNCPELFDSAFDSKATAPARSRGESPQLLRDRHELSGGPGHHRRPIPEQGEECQGL
jgi:hypothetical protein